MTRNISLLEKGECLSIGDRNVVSIIQRCLETFGGKVIARFAGGWVRDHLMGIENDDYDIAIEGASPLDFANAVKLQFPESTFTYLKGNPQEGIVVDIVRVNISEKNWFDITQLSSPLEDALHRDFTMNSLFFNINESKVEDYVKGLESIDEREIRIAVDPMIAFADEPRRILRCFRFVARFGFTIEQKIIDAIPPNANNFEQKLAPARIGMEIQKMLGAPFFNQAIVYIVKTGMLSLIFDLDSKLNLDGESLIQRINAVYKGNVSDDLVFAAIYYPLYKTRNQLTGVIRKYQMPHELAIRARRLQKLAYKFEDEDVPLDRVTVGKLIMESGENWEKAFYLLSSEKKEEFSAFIEFAERENLKTSYLLEPFFTPTELADIHGIKRGPNLPKYVDALIEWQLSNPDKDKDAYVSFIKTQSC